MKVKLCVISIMLVSSVLYGDSIYLNDNSITEGRVIQIIGESIEYDPDGEEVFRVIPKDKVRKIVYNDGTRTLFKYDKIALKNGKIIRGEILKAEKEGYYIYRDDLKQSVFLKRDNVKAIQLTNNRVISEMDDITEDTFDDSEPVKKLPGFHKSIISIRVVGGISLFSMRGSLMREEGRLLENYEAKIIAAKNTAENQYGYELYKEAYDVAIELDLMAPAIELEQSEFFSLTGIKFGLRGRYGYHSIELWSVQDVDASEYHTRGNGYGALLLDYTYFAVGPSFYLIFSPRNNILNFVLNGYCLYGHINRDTLNAGPSIRGAGVYLDPNESHMSFGGFVIKSGLGPQFTLNKYFPVLLGCNVTYAYTRIKTENPVPAYNNARTVFKLHEWGFEFFLGVHF